MTKVFFDISMSLDGFMTASNQRAEEPMGDGGQRLHEWAFSSADPRDHEVLAQGGSTTGAVIAGRRTYDTSIPWWGADGPTGPSRLPVVVVSHSGAPENIPERSVYVFENGIEAALTRAKAAAGGKDVTVMGGANIGQQYVRSGLVDEIWIHLVPVLFGAGTRMFEHLGEDHIPLETVEVIRGTGATHLHLRVPRTKG